MIDLRCEGYRGALEGVVNGEENFQLEYATRIGGIRRAEDSTFPAKDIIILWTSGAVQWWIIL